MVQFKILADGANLAYLDEGEGRPLLLIHGNTGTAQTHLGHLITQLQKSHRVIAPDLRGYGASQPPPRTYPPTSTGATPMIWPPCCATWTAARRWCWALVMAQKRPFSWPPIILN
ncbi:MAG: alpha/beta fold hydrolase [Chloroflexi bacterium]|nr:alpha/beta fold hydrolase [Chloroflexota bacterium]